MRYTHGHHEAVLRSHSWRTAANSAAYLLPHLRPGIDLLDVGCGPATITFDFARRVAPGRVVGVDASHEVVDTARNADPPSNVELVVGDVSALEFDDDSFDVVHAHQVLQHLADPVGALREMRRVCRDGGVVAARDSDYEAFTWYPDEPMLDAWLDLSRRIARANGGEPDAGRRLLAWARAAEFADVEASASAWCFATPADRAWWSSTWAERMSASAIARQAVDEGHATRGELDAIAEGWRRWGARPEGWFAVLHAEVLCRPV